MENLGDVFVLRLLGMGDWVFVCSPGTVKQIFKAPEGVLHAGEVHARMLAVLFGANATFNLDGEPHRQRQRIILPLLNGPAADEYIDLIQDASRAALASVRAVGETKLLPICHRLSLTVLVRATFGDDEPLLVERIVDEFHRYSNLGARSKLIQFPFLRVDLGPWSPWGRVVRLRRSIRQVIRRAARDQRESLAASGQDPVSILDHLVTTADDQGRQLDDEAIADEVMNLLFAGHETTGTVLAWVLAMILNRSEVLDAIVLELDSIIGDQPLEAAHLRQLTFLDAVINESIRINPIGPFSAFRQVKRDWQIEGERGIFKIPEGHVLAHSFPVMSLRDDLYPEARTFQPERFLDGKLDPYEWNPFGGGGRVCSGRGLAMVELKVAVVTALRQFHIETVLDSHRAVRSGHLLAPEQGMPVRVS